MQSSMARLVIRAWTAKTRCLQKHSTGALSEFGTECSRAVDAKPALPDSETLSDWKSSTSCTFPMHEVLRSISSRCPKKTCFCTGGPALQRKPCTELRVAANMYAPASFILVTEFAKTLSLISKHCHPSSTDRLAQMSTGVIDFDARVQLLSKRHTVVLADLSSVSWTQHLLHRSLLQHSLWKTYMLVGQANFAIMPQFDPAAWTLRARRQCWSRDADRWQRQHLQAADFVKCLQFNAMRPYELTKILLLR